MAEGQKGGTAEGMRNFIKKFQMVLKCSFFIGFIAGYIFYTPFSH